MNPRLAIAVEPTGSTTIHRCGACGHKDGDHLGADGWGAGSDRPRLGFCSSGGCPCNLSPREVRAATKPETIPTWAA